MKKSTLATCFVATIASLSLSMAGVGGASAATVTGWTGAAGPNGDNLAFLTNSTIINSPTLTANSKIWTAFAQTVPDGEMGVKPRLFKSGALCEAVDYQYNPYPAAEWLVGTSATCGSGSYNSHGFVSVWNGTNAYREAVTFPSNPLNWTAPTARTAKAQSTVTDSDRVGGVNAKGEKFGSAATEGSEDLDLILAIADNGNVGYVKASDLNGPSATDPTSALKAKPSKRVVPTYAKDGLTVTGEFTVNS